MWCDKKVIKNHAYYFIVKNIYNQELNFKYVYII
jgi:hypothetical protein